MLRHCRRRGCVFAGGQCSVIAAVVDVFLLEGNAPSLPP